MKRFTEFLAENNHQDLYHGTSFDNVESILKDGHLHPSSNGRLSVSRSRRYAKQWSSISNHHSAMFVLNGNTVRHNHHVGPTDFDHHGGVYDKERYQDVMEPSEGRRSESEEAIKGKVHLRHVKELHISRKAHDELMSPHRTESEKETHDMDPTHTHWMFKGMHHEDRMKRAKEFSNLVKKHGIKIHLHD
jgi:hypothetical protein